jgi:hypothetical protein
MVAGIAPRTFGPHVGQSVGRRGGGEVRFGPRRAVALTCASPGYSRHDPFQPHSSRDQTDSDRTVAALRGTEGKRRMYRETLGKQRLDSVKVRSMQTSTATMQRGAFS